MIHKLAAFCFFALLLTPALHAQKKRLEDQMQGTWKVVATKRNGEDADVWKGDQITFQKGSFSVKPKNGQPQKGTYDMDESDDPATFKLIPGKANEEPFQGRIGIEDGKLKLCLARPGKPRPEKLESTPGSGTLLLTLERVN